jgi:CubicO group peptidase (beta-lactamase class C family)
MRDHWPPTRRARLSALVLLAVSSVARGPTGAPSPERERLDAAAIDSLLRGYTRTQIFSGEVLVARGDQLLLHERYGHYSWPERQPLPAGGLYKIGSVTKSFTAAAILRLEQKGLLTTDDEVSRHIPELPAQLSGRDGVPVTIHQLVTHTSGLPDPVYANFWGPEQRFATVIESLQGESLRATPGGAFRYSNLGYALLGEIIRRRSGQSFEQFLRSELLEPAGMLESGVELGPQQRDRMVPGHVSDTLRLVPAKAAFGRFVTGNYDWDLLANGNLFSSASDLHRWVRSLQDGTAFPPEVMTKLQTPGLRGQRHDYGYGWIRKSIAGWEEPLYWHNGAIIPFGYTAAVAWTPRSKLCIVILSNLDDTAVADNVFDNVLAVIRGQPPAPPQAGVDVKGSYLTIQILALLLGTPLLAALYILYLLWALLRKPARSRVEAWSMVASVTCLGSFVAIVLASALGWLALLLSAALAVRYVLASREQPLLHDRARKQWTLTTGSALSSVAVLAMAIFVLAYFGWSG